MSLQPIGVSVDLNRNSNILIRQVNVSSTDTQEFSDVVDFGAPVVLPVVLISGLDLDTQGGDHNVRRVVASARAETPLNQASNTVKVIWNLSVADDSGNHLVGGMTLTIIAFQGV